MNGWIDIKSEEPEEGEYFLVCNDRLRGGYIEIARTFSKTINSQGPDPERWLRWLKERGRTNIVFDCEQLNNTDVDGEVTHWMPLPELPKAR